MQPVLTVLKGSDARRRYKPPARPYHLFYYTGFVNTFTENGRTFYPYPPLQDTSFHRKGLPSAARRGWLPFLAAKPSPLCIPHAGKALYREKRYSRIVAFPIGEGGPRSGG